MGDIASLREMVLHQLTVYLNQHMSYKCIHRKFGTILYRKATLDNSPNQDVYGELSLPEQSGWVLEDNGDYSMDWDCPKVSMTSSTEIEFLKAVHVKRGVKQDSVGVEK